MSTIGENFSYSVLGYEKVVDETINELKAEKIIDRIWEKDYTVWSNSPAEISNRLGWLHSPENSMASLSEINKFVGEIKNEKYENALLLGMGGSSLAPEVLKNIYGFKTGSLQLSVLDSTDPGAILNMTNKYDPAKTLYIVSTKSGGTIETISFMKHFYNFVLGKLGAEEVTKHFIAITDPDSGLQRMAEDLKFRKIFLNDSNIGGRYSALSLFGIVPAALMGIDVEKLLSRALEAGDESKKEESISGTLGAILGTLAEKNIDKVTLVTSGQINPLGVWLEQLVAESTGKNGKGILPVESESIESSEFYSKDRVFVYIKLKGDKTNDTKAQLLRDAGFPFLEIIWNDLYDLGAEFMRWELATAIASWKLKIQPFDQPNVESAKILARAMINSYNLEGKLPLLNPIVKENGIMVYGDVVGKNIKDVLNGFLEELSNKNIVPLKYLSLQAYLTPEDKTTKALQELRTKIQKKFKVATTVGYGPRFLHSTGQLHKGDSGNGLFIQFTSQIQQDVAIPEEAGKQESTLSFGTLIQAQALGDLKALQENKRKVIRFDLGNNVAGGIKKLSEMIELF
ncbi:glucose-6-phosphate isomerase [bacterium]|nr:glucose-6-phosphate isomerase [bacterium]